VARVVGIDPGSLSLDLCGLDDGRPFLDVSLPAGEVARAPATVLDHVAGASPLDLIAAPSGYGLPLVPVAEVDDRTLALLLLVREEDRCQPEQVGGLRAIIEGLRERRWPAVLLPGVIHLPSVPAHRKVNRIDLGTADKLCVAALAVHDQARRLEIGPGRTSFLLLELGGAFTAGLAVEDGQVVDGIGGAGGGLGYRALGTLDGEVAYTLGHVRKAALFSGGATAIAGEPDLPAEVFAERAAASPAARLAWDAYLEALEKMVATLRVSVARPREVLLSGRLARVPAIATAAAHRLIGVAPTLTLTGLGMSVKEAAQGAALIADGLAGGACRDLVAAMRLREAHGSILDHLYLDGAAAIRRQFGLA
jgi:predicted butyrate kinase (DUF1464 family)